MRPIKFRGKRIDNGEWVEGWFIKSENGEYSRIVVSRKKSDYFWEYGFHDVHPATIGQFTGLQDKNGVDIFEGDIYRVGYFAINDGKKFGEKPWENLPESQDEEELTTIIDELLEVEPPHIRSISSLYDLIHNDPDIIGVEITGNIHDTPSEKGE